MPEMPCELEFDILIHDLKEAKAAEKKWKGRKQTCMLPSDFWKVGENEHVQDALEDLMEGTDSEDFLEDLEDFDDEDWDDFFGEISEYVDLVAENIENMIDSLELYDDYLEAKGEADESEAAWDKCQHDWMTGGLNP